MLRTNAILIFMLISATLCAQVKLSKDFKITNSKPYKVVDARTKEYFSDMKGFTYSVKTDRERVFLQKFSVDGMKETARKEYADFSEKNNSVGIVELQGKFYYIYESHDDSDIKTVGSREIITEDCSLGKEVVLFSSKGPVANGPSVEKIGFFGLRSGPPFTVFTSFDESKFMIQYRRKPVNKKDAQNHDLIGFYVFDNNFDKVWGREVRLPYNEEDINNLAYIVASDGTVYMMVYHNSKKNIQLLKIPAEGEIAVHEIQHGGFLFNKLLMNENPDGNINCMGYYGNGIEFNYWEGKISFNANGINIFEISKTGDVLASNEIEFPIDLINLYATDKQQKKNNKREDKGKAGIKDLKLREFTVNPDGSMFILGEQFYVIQETNGKVIRYHFYYRDLVAAKINPDGKVAWMKKLPKRQEGYKGRGGLGISYIKSRDAHYILYLDNVKNASLKTNKIPEKHIDGKGGYLTAYKIDDATGDAEKLTLYNSAKVNGVKTYQFMTSRILQANEKTLMVEVYKKDKEDIMIKMELAE